MTGKRLKISKIVAVLLIFCLSINSFAAIVSDNDGSAFVTKAEFEVLKKDFADQVINYNDSIDNKIDGAIASYLAGIELSKKVALENKYEIINPTWMRNKRFDKSKKGTKYTIFISFTEGVYSMSASSTGFMSYCFEGTATGWYVNKNRIKNEDDPEYLYRIQKKKIGPFENQWSLQDLIQAEYSMTIGGGAAGGRGGPIGIVNRLALPDYTLFKKGDNKYFGTWYSDLPVAIWSVDGETKGTKEGYITGSSGNGETLAITAIAKDIQLTDDSMFYLAGGTVVGDTMYCLNIASISEIGDSYASAKTNAGGSRQFYWNTTTNSWPMMVNWNGGYYDDTEVEKPYYGNIETEIYRHVLNELNATELLNETLTQAMNEKVYYYSGCPLCSTDAAGTVTFKIKFVNTEGAKTKWALDSKQFTNTANPGNCGDIENCSEKTFLADNNELITVSFSAKKDKTYWIKAEPESGFSKIEFVGGINFVGE
ncbi:MAG: hypothetical protein IJP71_00690 [Lachnospiraceae bacterium]|nr:hypothetical protein [Lachnospiraceae bacterium]